MKSDMHNFISFLLLFFADLTFEQAQLQAINDATKVIRKRRSITDMNCMLIGFFFSFTFQQVL